MTGFFFLFTARDFDLVKSEKMLRNVSENWKVILYTNFWQALFTYFYLLIFFSQQTVDGLAPQI